MKTIYYGLLPIILSILLHTGPGRDEGIPAARPLSPELPQRVDNALARFRNDYPQEKVFLHTDKNLYLSGETIWFNFFLTLEGRPSFLSRIGYVELVNDKGMVVAKRMYKLKDGVSSGEILLDNKLPAGNYSLNAYTLWMKNFPGFIFKKPLYIFNTDYGSSQKVLEEKQNEYSIQFFPEGGDLVNGISSTVAFKAVNGQGMPVAVKGEIRSKAGRKIADLVTEHDGMGSFEINPEAGQQYLAEVESARGIKKTAALPQAGTEGVVISVNNEKPGKLFVVMQRGELNAAKYNDLYVVAQMHGFRVFSGRINFDNGEAATAINKTNLPAGILHITAFDTTGRPLAERLAFIHSKEKASPILAADTLSKEKKKLNVFSLKLSDYSSPLVSVSVTDAGRTEAPGREENILSAMLVSSDLRGYIHQPGYYFADGRAEAARHLDLLMLTQGWRRFKWEKILNNDFAQLQYPVESFITVRGRALTVNKTPLTNGRADLITEGEDSTKVLSTATFNANGEFMVTELDFKKKARILYQATDNKMAKVNAEISLYPAFIDSLKRSDGLPGVDLDSTVIYTRADDPAYNSIIEKIRAKRRVDEMLRLEEVKVVGKRRSRVDSLNAEYATGAFQISAFTIDPNNGVYISIWQLIRQQVPGLTVEGDQNSPDVRLNRAFALGTAANSDATDEVNADYSLTTNGIAYFMNEVQVPKEVIDNVSVDDVALIKFFRTEAAGFTNAPAAIAVYTKKGESARSDPREKIFFSEERLGYSLVREFYHPDYRTDDPKAEDLRTTLYWNPRLKINKEGQGRIHFYNNDRCQAFKVIINGIDKDGTLIHEVRVF